MDKHFIVLNGKRYDAVTGALLGPALDNRLSNRTHTPANPHLSRLQPSHKPTHHAPTVPAAPRPARDHHQAKSVNHHRAEPAKTLMRRAVAKPDTPSQLPTTRRHYPIAQKTPGLGISPKLSVSTVDHGRMHRAQATPKSTHVGKFTHATAAGITPQLKPLAVASAPAHPSHTSLVPAVTHTAQEVAHKASDIFEQAIATATSHEQPKHEAHKKARSGARRKLVSSLAALGAIVVIGGFLAYANKATVQLQVASVKAGFQASMPSYAPEGFERKTASAQDGAVAINFVSPMSNKSFALTQESSDWDSQTLFDSVVAQSDSSYQTVQSNGRTIYIYGNDQAAWVDGGILYKVSGNSGLSSDQVISLAASM